MVPHLWHIQLSSQRWYKIGQDSRLKRIALYNPYPPTPAMMSPTVKRPSSARRSRPPITVITKTVTVTGTFQRPLLTLAFDGMVFESRQVKDTLQGSYTTVAAIGATLTLTAPGYSRDVALLLNEK